MNRLSVYKIDFKATFTKDVLLPSYLGNSIRGALGQALLRNFCTQKNPNCDKCRRSADCVYPNVFKTPDNLPGFSGTTINPIVINLQYTGNREYSEGTSFDFSLSLFGRATAFVKQILTAADDMLHGALSSLKYNFRKTNDWIWSDEGELTPVDKLKVTFLTPTCIIRNNELVLELSFPVFIEFLFSRISTIIDLYSDSNFIVPYRLIARMPYIESECSVKKVSIKQKDFTFEGITGNVLFSGDVSSYMPYIALGTMLHIGKLSTRGCGEYTCKVMD